jgi:hypothetical protein
MVGYQEVIIALVGTLLFWRELLKRFETATLVEMQDLTKTLYIKLNCKSSWRSCPFQIRTREQASLRYNGFIKTYTYIYFYSLRRQLNVFLLTLLFRPWALRLANVVAGVWGSYCRRDVRWPTE